ncbi:unnamed protein product [Effrenium voratum]|uniref:Uncharacterized protein n=1 Tax=Effrenium voratum TaxID=2562239 RepID=A0AA36IZE7_9DINO|nr:unnamed protein product [Effrenium voratum]
MDDEPEPCGHEPLVKLLDSPPSPWPKRRLATWLVALSLGLLGGALAANTLRRTGTSVAGTQELIQAAEARWQQVRRRPLPLGRRVLQLPALETINKIHKRRSAAENRRWEEATCGISASIAAEKLALLGLQLESSVYHCAPSRISRTVCASDISGVIATFAAAASYLSAVANACPQNVTSSAAACSADVFDIIYGVGTLASALATAEQECEEEARTKNKAIAEERRPVTLGMCVLNVAQATSYIGHAVISIRAAKVDCENKQLSNRAASCATQISGALQSVSLVAAYLSNAAAMCGATIVAGAECSNRIGSVVAGMAEVSAGGSATALDCISEPSRNSTIRAKTLHDPGMVPTGKAVVLRVRAKSVQLSCGSQSEQTGTWQLSFIFDAMVPCEVLVHVGCSERSLPEGEMASDAAESLEYRWVSKPVRFRDGLNQEFRGEVDLGDFMAKAPERADSEFASEGGVDFAGFELGV